MSGRLYVCNMASTPTAVTASVDLFEIVAPSTAAVALHGLWLGQTTELGDAMEEQLVICVKRGQTTSGSGGTGSATPVALGPADAAAGSGFETFNTTKASAGTIVTLFTDVWNVRTNYQMLWTPETQPWIAPSQRATVELVSTPGDSISITGCLILEELG